jgi:large subunit ribosomal protein L25
MVLAGRFSLEQIKLKAKIRTTVGNGPARVLRRDGKLPAVLYGPKKEPILLSVEVKDVEQILKQGGVSQALLNLFIQNGKEASKPAMIKELQVHPVSGKFLHVDFYEIDMERKIRVGVPVIAVGDAKGVELGGLLSIIRRELEVLCLPTQIPDAIEVDVTDLDVGDSVHVEEIPLPEGVEVAADVNFTVITVLAPKLEAEPEEEEEELEEEGVEAEEGAEPSEQKEETETTKEG